MKVFRSTLPLPDVETSAGKGIVDAADSRLVAFDGNHEVNDVPVNSVNPFRLVPGIDWPRRACIPLLLVLPLLAACGPDSRTDSGRQGSGVSSNAPASQVTKESMATNASASPQVPEDPLTDSHDALVTDAERAIKLMNAGDDALAQGRAAEAIAAYQESLKLDPTSESLHFNLAIALTRAGRTNEALAEYRESLRIAPDYGEAHNNLGNLLVRLGRPAEALPHLVAAVRINPQIALNHNNLGTALGRLRRNREALAEFEKAVSLKADYFEARFNLGNALLIEGDTAGAARQFTEVLRLKPDFAPARQQMERIAAAHFPR